MSPGDPRIEASGLLGMIGGLLYKRESIMDVAPVVSEHGHEIIGLRVTVRTGDVIVVRVEPETP